ncbi:CDP-glycerol glycerophosphotransferase family protein [Oceanobacillus sp. CAU 1775]
MAREIVISIYLFVFQLLFNMFKIFPQKNKTIGVASFGDNIFYATKALRSLSEEEIVILKDSSSNYTFDESQAKVISFQLKSPFAYLKSIYHLATATTVMVDTYQAFLAVTNFRPGTTCIQLWHAAGAIKHFGLKDPSNAARSQRAMERFQKVYDSFDYTVVGSENMVDVFKESFGLTDDRVLRTGIPRTDALFDSYKKHDVLKDMKKKYPQIRERKIILYTPTFRKQQLSGYQLELDISSLYQELSDQYVLLVKLHPAVSGAITNQFEDFVIDVSNYKDTNELLLITDLLISDYSSIPFEFALLEKPMIFFAYDIDTYRIESGLIEGYEDQMPGPVVLTTTELINVIQQEAFEFDRLRTFKNQWNEYSDGNSSLKLAQFITKTDEKSKKAILV